MLSVPASVEEFLRNRKVFCGFSGGSDSLFLLLALKQLSAPLSFVLEAVHFNHGLRGAESDADAQWCEAKCAAELIPFRKMDLQVNRNRRAGEGDEAAARRLRLEQWKLISHENPDCTVALGHNADDRTENLFLRLFRGSNTTGLTSMRSVSRVDGILFVRPLLSISKSEMEAFLREKGQAWRVDSTNLTDVYKRNFLRLNILPEIEGKFPFARKGILRSVSAVECDAAFIESAAECAYRKMCGEHDFSPSAWRSLHRALFCRVLRYFLTDRAGRDFIPDFSLIERFEFAVNHPPEGGESLQIELKDDGSQYLCVERENVSLKNRSCGVADAVWNRLTQKTIRFGCFELESEELTEVVYGDSFSAYFSDSLPETLLLSVRRNGDRMVPFGKHSPVLLKKLFSDAKLRCYEQEQYPLLSLIDRSILWIPGVKRSNLWTVSDGNRKCIRISARKVNG